MAIETNQKQKNVIRQRSPIAAIASAFGESAIAVVRMSGEGILEIGDKVFRKHNSPSFSFLKAETHTAHYGRLIKNNHEIVDEVLAILFKSPHSYTAEDSIEINCHGGVVVTEEVLRCLLDAGCRLAEPGEFTKRAFLNGKIDLSQAEAIGELIHAKTSAAYKSALSHLKGDLASRLAKLRQELIRASALFELEFDFAEEDVEFQSRDELLNITQKLIDELKALSSTFEHSKALKEGLKVAIVGKANVGKSTLMNALIGKDRAIVSKVAGTTRDYLQEPFLHDGVLFQLVDTAGFRESSDSIEKEGIRRTQDQSQNADIIIYVFDISSTAPSYAEAELNQLKLQYPKVHIIPVGNKMDLGDINSHLKDQSINYVKISAHKKQNLHLLLDMLKNIAIKSNTTEDSSLMITNLRHYQALKSALESLEDAKEMLVLNQNLELIASCFRISLHQIATITGEVTTDDILNFIFEKFCIGK